MRSDARQRRLPAPLSLYLLLGLLIGPPLAGAGVWMWAVLAGFQADMNMTAVRDRSEFWLSLITVLGAAAFLLDLVLAPFVLGAVKWRRAWLTAPLSLGLGLAAGVYAWLQADTLISLVEPLQDVSLFVARDPVLRAWTGPVVAALAFAVTALTSALTLRVFGRTRRERPGLAPRLTPTPEPAPPTEPAPVPA